MQKHKKIAIIGGDARYLRLIHSLQRINWLDVVLIGFDKVEQSYTGVKQSSLEELIPEELDAIILPITGIHDDGKVETVFSNKEWKITEDWFKRLPGHCVIFTGITSSTLEKWVTQYDYILEELMERDDIAIYNSIPTAEGAIMLAIQHTDITIHQANIFIYGFGRVGQTTANKFAGLGANITIVSKSEVDLSRAFEQGYRGILLKDSSKYIDQCEILINTIPAIVITESVLNNMESNKLIIDLASKPGGIDFDFAKERGIQTIHALGLPGLVAPKTAGEILGNIIVNRLQED
ncbi:dipicolinic acid synthetase subunit A [Gracilibacillus oryzae]|uniref:Dipicolinic acid synthetase subunit A n=1 Tax=Gracilibacillus oryzae TaxID=1672701 RepID=A0A7C8KTV9_9BACI|nr:dipicolinic acid synthetase subunit A [Gracilibacillus oryzae]KAB8138787.1 dipicolinic acid synthetase subunit A [Gracilibacillus oryzae]